MCTYSKEGNNQLYLVDQGRLTNEDTVAKFGRISRDD